MSPTTTSEVARMPLEEPAPTTWITPRSTRPSYPRLPRLRGFSAHVVSILPSSPLTIVLKIRWNHAFHILKLYQPPEPGLRRALEYEYTAYSCLEVTAPSCVPRCRGLTAVKTRRLKFPKRLAKDKVYAAIQRRESWRGLVLEFIPDAVSLENYLAEGICDGLKAKVVQGLERVHEAGVLHHDPVGRNCLVQRLRRADPEETPGAETEEGFRIWWIDFDCALTTGGSDIAGEVFRAEIAGIGQWMRGEKTADMYI